MSQTSELSSSPDSMTSSQPTAAILLIGNELLSGKIRDENAYFLTKELRRLGVAVQRILVIPDEVELIGKEVAALSEAFTYVFTSGGVGPTHDDVTLEGIAHGFEDTLSLHPKLHELLSTYFAERLNDAHLRMANIPSQSTLIWSERSPWPVYTYRNVYIFAGVPSVLRAKFSEVAEHFRSDHFYLRSLDLHLDEGSIAHFLGTLEEKFDVMVGSYPRVSREIPYLVRVTIESKQAEQVNQAVTLFLLTLHQKIEAGELEIPSDHQRDQDHSHVSEIIQRLPDQLGESTGLLQAISRLDPSI